MSRYRKIEVAVWTDEKFRSLTPAPPNAQSLWLYLLCGPRTTALPGLVIAGELVMAADLGWTVEAFREAFAEVFAKGMAEASWKGGLVVLTKALFDSTGEPRETAKPQSPNVIRSWAKAWDEVPDCDLKNMYLKTLESFAKALGEAFAKAFQEAFRKALAKASRHPSPIQDSGTGTGTGTGSTSTSPVVVREKKARSKKEGRRQRPAEWTPNDSHARLARELGVSDLGYQADSFRRHHDAKGSVFKNWDQAFENWLRNSVEFGTSRRTGSGNSHDGRYGRAPESSLVRTAADHEESEEHLRKHAPKMLVP